MASAIALRMQPDPISGIQMNAATFWEGFIWMIDKGFSAASRTQVRDFYNIHLQDNGNPVLTTAEEDEIGAATGSLRADYNASGDPTFWRDKLRAYCEQLNEGGLTPTQWDSQFGF